MKNKTIALIGGGAAGFFGAIICAENYPEARVIILEKNRQILSKVRISGGGRCNVTHACFDPALLVQNYPRGYKELRGPFTRFQPRDTMHWFEAHGVPLKIEGDGRVFPASDSSESIISCLIKATRDLKIEIETETAVTDIQKQGQGFLLSLAGEKTLECDALLIAAGGNSKVQGWLEKFGHTFVPSVPSLFTFNIANPFWHALAGISVPKAKVTLVEAGLEQVGPLLITHWGFSGPAVLKLSAWGARFLHDKQYKTTFKIDWLPDLNESALKSGLDTYRKQQAARLVHGDSPFVMPKNLWKALLTQSQVGDDVRWATLSKQQMVNLIQQLHASTFQIEGKSTYKEEFVTCGGVKLEEVDFKTMQSRLCPNLYFAGEVLDIDGVTGGFNFQNAWTTAWLAGQSMGK